MKRAAGLWIVALAAMVLVGGAAGLWLPKALHAASNGMLLTGSVKSASGEKMAGVTVSAKAEGATITTTVFTDEQGNYYFPAMEAAKYDVWAQADTFETARGQVELSTTKHQDFVLKPMKDFARQLTGDQLLASLPEDTADDRRLKRIFRNNCTNCHEPNYILQNRFDEEGWVAIMNLMRDVTVFGGYMGEDAAPAPNIEFHKKELAAYLAKARGPGETSMKFKIRPRPVGDAARVVFNEYDVPLDPANGYETKYMTNNGSDWSLGTPSVMHGGNGVHDVQADLSGNIWFTYSVPSSDITLGRVDTKTGDVKFLKVPGARGMAAASHGLTRDGQGNLWFNVINPAETPGIGALGRLNPSTEKIDEFFPPKGMTGTQGTIDVDGKGKVWITTNIGVLRFDPDTRQFTEFKSSTFTNADGIGTTYGLAADREGNAWWAELSIDIVGHSDVETGKSLEVKLPPVQAQLNNLNDADRKLYAITGSDWGSAVPWREGPRRLGADKQGNFVYVCDYYGGNIAKIDIHTQKATLIPLPRPDSQEPYHATVDKNHNVWVNVMSSDSIMRFNPATSQWTEFTLPTLGAETRYISLLEQNGSLQVILPYWRTRKVARMTLRTKEDVQALKNKVQQQEQALVR